MAISSTDNRKVYSGDGTVTQFAFPYAYHSYTDLQVRTRTGSGSGTVEVTVTLGGTVTVLPLADATAGGTVTFATAPDASTSVVIYRDPPQTQTLDLVADGEMPAESVEKAIDKVILIAQRLQEQLTRAAVLSASDTSLAMTLPYVGDRTSSFLGFDASGRFTSYALSDLTNAAVSTFWQTVLDDTNASQSLVTLGFSPYMVTLRDDTNASGALVTLGVSPWMIGNLLDDTASVQARATLGVYGDSPMMLHNASFKAEVTSSALRLSLCTADGGSPSASSPVIVAFRNSSLNGHDYTVVTVTTQPTMTLDWSSTLGLPSAQPGRVYGFLLNNAGTVELAAMGKANVIGDNGNVTTTAVGTTGTADSGYTLYSTTARTGVAARMLGMLEVSNTTSGDWNASPTFIITNPLNQKRAQRSEFVLNAFAGQGSAANKIPYFTNVEVSVGTAMTLQNDSTNGCAVTIKEEGLYSAMFSYRDASVAQMCISLNAAADVTQSAFGLSEAKRLMGAQTVAAQYSAVAITERFSPGDIVRPHTNGLASGGSETKFRIIKIAD